MSFGFFLTPRTMFTESTVCRINVFPLDTWWSPSGLVVRTTLVRRNGTLVRVVNLRIAPVADHVLPYTSLQGGGESSPRLSSEEVSTGNRPKVHRLR